ncbi:Peptidase S28 family-containing protein [Aphelenchoides besseyi]|nr:Peptidase S28 family-containing protein [Aphelenchoides besseyi]
MRYFVFLLTIVGCAVAWPVLHFKSLKSLSNVNDNVKVKNFTQKLCHFDPSVKDTWQHRYWQNDAFVKDENGSIFLYLGAADAEKPDPISDANSPLVIWGKQLNARLFVLESRFYGESRPTADQSIDNLKYLHGSQSVEDVTDFIKSKTKELGSKGPWILFGQQYGATIVLNHRLKHPDLTVGGLASSSMYDSVFDAYEIALGAERSYRNYNSNCADKIRDGFISLQEHLDYAEGRADLQDAFNFDPDIKTLNLTYQHINNIVHVILGHFLAAAQFSEVNAFPWNSQSPRIGIPSVCSIMVKKALNPVVPIANVVEYIQKYVFQSKDGKVNVNYDTVMGIFSFPAWSNPFASKRANVWQNCQEIGQVPTTTYNGIFGTDVPVNYFYGICHDIFDGRFTADYVQGKMAETTKMFSDSKSYNGTNVLIPYGSVDPGKGLGIAKSNNPSVVTVLIDGTSTGADLLPANDTTDPQSLKDFRKLALKTIQGWISGKSAKAVEKQIVEKQTYESQSVSDFEGELCFDCGSPNNKIEHNKPTAEMQKKFDKLFIGGRHSKGFLRSDIVEEMAKNGKRLKSADKGSIMQPVDHFNKSDSRNFKQVVYSNDVYYQKGGPLFLFISGESEANSVWIENEQIPLVQWAKKHNAMLYMLEHRFYGESQPLSKMTVENLKYLTSKQALEDLAAFIRSTNKKLQLKDPKWVTFGGSYSGALSAWFREKYPDLTVAAVGSSGPVQAEVDFYGYLQTVEAALRSYSDKCANAAKHAYDYVHQLFTTVEGRSKINQGLDVYPEFDGDYVEPYNAMAFAFTVISPIMSQVQYSGRQGSVEDVCEGFLGNGDDFQKILAANEYSTPIADLNEFIDYYKRDSSSRAWLFQTCNEFGYFQSSDIGYSIFGAGVPVNMFLRLCDAAIGPSFTREKIEANVKATNTYYGGRDNYRSTNVIQIYGSIDPWHYLGYYPITATMLFRSYIQTCLEDVQQMTVVCDLAKQTAITALAANYYCDIEEGNA